MAHAIAFASAQRLFAGRRRDSYGRSLESLSPLGGISWRSASVAQSSVVPLRTKSGTYETHLRRIRSAAREEGGSFLEEMEFDVIVIGAGVIGLTVANRILTETTFSVVVVDAKRPCAGATGAGEFSESTDMFVNFSISLLSSRTQNHALTYS